MFVWVWAVVKDAKANGFDSCGGFPETVGNVAKTSSSRSGYTLTFSALVRSISAYRCCDGGNILPTINARICISFGIELIIGDGSKLVVNCLPAGCGCLHGYVIGNFACANIISITDSAPVGAIMISVAPDTM